MSQTSIICMGGPTTKENTVRHDPHSIGTGRIQAQALRRRRQRHCLSGQRSIWSLLRRLHYPQSQASSAKLRCSHYATQDSHCRRSLTGRHGRRDTLGLVTDNHGEQHLARIAILIVPGIERNLFSVKSATKKGVVSIFDFNNPKLELSGITVPLRAEDDDLYSLVLDLSADSHGGKEMAMNAMTNAKLWHRWLGHFNKRRLELMQGRDGNGVAFDGLIDHCNVRAVGKSPQLAHPKKAKHAYITAPFQMVYGDLMGPSKPAARGGYEYVSKITHQFTKWTAVYVLCTKNQTLASLQLLVTSTVVPFGSRIVTWRADKSDQYTGEDPKRIARRRASLSSLRLLTRHNKSAFRNALDGHCARWSDAYVLTADYRHFFGGAHDGRVVHLQSDSALGTKHGDAIQGALREGHRPLLSQDHRRKGLRTHQKPKQARAHDVGRDGVRLQRDREQLLPHGEPKNASRGG